MRRDLLNGLGGSHRAGGRRCRRASADVPLTFVGVVVGLTSGYLVVGCLLEGDSLLLGDAPWVLENAGAAEIVGRWRISEDEPSEPERTGLLWTT